MLHARYNVDGEAFAPDALAKALGTAHATRLLQLDAAADGAFGGARAGRGQPRPAPLGAPDAKRPVSSPVDVVVAGGGLSVLLAALLARAGHRVVVLERSRAAWAHREWNASAQELEALVAAGLLSHRELAELVVQRYRYGTCSWHRLGSTKVRGVLDCAVDAAALLQKMRALAEDAGAQFIDGAEVVGTEGQQEQVWVSYVTQAPAQGSDRTPRAAHLLGARCFLDARGAQSPFARPDLLCPTVGGVFEGLIEGAGSRRWQAQVGEILATTRDLQDGRQYLWEAFPGRRGQVTVYLFTYARAQDLPKQPLETLYRRFWRWLPEYKEGPARLIRPTYGIIPGWSRLSPAPKSPHRRILLVGDAAARHSPLTFCGFGAMLRSLAPCYRAVRHLLQDRPGAVPLAVDDTPLHATTGALALLMARPPAAPDAMNRLLNAAFGTLAEMGQAAYAGLLQDRLPPREVLRFGWRVRRQEPAVWRWVLASLGPVGAARWAARLTAAAAARPRRGHALPP